MNARPAFLKYKLPCHGVLLALITLHLFLMNGFYPTHRQLTVGTYFTSVRNFADPTLYKNSIYIQAVNRTNLRISLAYDVMPWILEHIDFELFGILQGLVSIFFIIAGLYRLTILWFNNKTAAYFAALLYTPALNTWALGSPAPYLNFYHHGLPLTYPLMIWSMVFFWQKNFVIAFLLAGCSWNFHPMCTAFLVFAYCVYWLFHIKMFTLRQAGACLAVFLLASLLSFIKAYRHISESGGSGPLWLKGVSWVAGYTCFPSEWPLSWFVGAVLFFVLFGLCYVRIENFALKQWIAVFVFSVLVLCLIGTVFADIIPVPFVIKASLWRSTVVYLFVALPCIAWMLARLCMQSLSCRFIAITLAFLLTGYVPDFTFQYLPFYIFLTWFILFVDDFKKKTNIPMHATPIIATATLLGAFLCVRLFGKPTTIPILFLLAVAVWIMVMHLLEKGSFFRTGIRQAVFFVLVFDAAVLFYNGGPDIYFHGKVKGRTDPWADIQKYAQTISNKDDLFIVPPHMNDFPLYSYRAVLGDWAEGSTLLYLDNKFTEEWFERMYDLGWTEKDLCNKGYNRLTTAEIVRVARKYGAGFIVTEKPKTFDLRKIYENDKFILYSAET